MEFAIELALCLLSLACGCVVVTHEPIRRYAVFVDLDPSASEAQLRLEGQCNRDHATRIVVYDLVSLWNGEPFAKELYAVFLLEAFAFFKYFCWSACGHAVDCDEPIVSSAIWAILLLESLKLWDHLALQLLDSFLHFLNRGRGSLREEALVNKLGFELLQFIVLSRHVTSIRKPLSMDKTKLMTIKEFAEIVQIAPKTLYRLASAGKIPCIRIGRNLRFSHDMIQQMRKP